MSFRKIRPSFGDNSASTSNPSQSTSESTGSDPRRVRSEKDVETGSSISSTKRRRVPDSVTRNACLNCKKARAKCDGKKPCKRCASRIETSECIYEVHIKHAKEELVKQIKELMAKDHLTEQILQALSTDEKIPEILDRLKNGETYESIVEWLGRSPTADMEAMSPRESQLSMLEGSDQDMGATNFRWTSVTSDTAVLDHLFQLYFAWVHPVHTLFSEGHFVDSYKRQSDAYCSPILVNAICAMACYLHSGSDTDEADFEQLGRDFNDAVRSTLDADDRNIATVQTFAVMFLVGCARGEALHAASYLKIATANLPRVALVDMDGFLEVMRNCARGLRHLNVEWAQITFQVPPALNHSIYRMIEEPDNKLDDAKWYFYRYMRDSCPAWPGLLATTNREKSKLIGIISDISTMLYSEHAAPITALSVLQQYSRLVTWRGELPETIGNIEYNSSQALPHVLSLLILFESAVVQLLRPLLDYDGLRSTSIEEAVWNHAQRGLFFLDEHYRTQYTCRYQPVMQMFALLHLTDVIARFFPGGVEGSSKDGPEAIHFGFDALTQSRAGFAVAGPLQEMLRKTANECSIRLPKDALDIAGGSRRASNTQIYRVDDLVDACTRPSYVQPVEDIHSRYFPSFNAEWAAEAGAYGFQELSPGARRLRVSSAEERGAQSLMQIRNLLNSN